MQADLPASIESWISTLQRCAQEKSLVNARYFHVKLCLQQLDLHPVVANYVIPMFVQCGNLLGAQQVFDRLPRNFVNHYSWNSLLSGYIEHGNAKHAIHLYYHVQSSECSLQPDGLSYLAMLNACARLKYAEEGKRLHADIIRKGLEWEFVERDATMGNALIDMYTKCGLVEEAHKVFVWLPAKDAVSWAALISGYTEKGFSKEVRQILQQLLVEYLCPDSVMFVCILKACGMLQDLRLSQEIHSQTTKRGMGDGLYIGNALIDTYGKFGLHVEAGHVLYTLPVRDVVSWNALINGYAEHGLIKEVMNSCQQMMTDGISPDAVTYISCLKASCVPGGLESGKHIHVETVKRGLEQELRISCTLLDMYTEHGVLTEACHVFNGLQSEDQAVWNALISGYIDHGFAEQALDCLQQLMCNCLSPNTCTYASCLRACGYAGALQNGQELHCETIKKGVHFDHNVIKALVDMYNGHGLLAEAHMVFSSLPARSSSSWNILIAGYADNGLDGEATSCLKQMLADGISPDLVTYIYGLQLCGSRQALETGKDLHIEITNKGLDEDVYVGSTLVDMYFKCGLLEEAHHVFDRLEGRNVVTWNALITGYNEYGMEEEALCSYQQMLVVGISPDVATFSCCLNVCASIQALNLGREMHSEAVKRGFEREVPVGSMLVALYCTCGWISDAFQTIDPINSASWNKAVGSKLHPEAGPMSQEILLKGSFIGPAGVICGMKICSSIGALEAGKVLHAEIAKRGLEREFYIGSMLVEMYINCNLIAEARIVTDELNDKTVWLWNTLITAFAEQGLAEEVEKCYDQMMLEGISPDSSTFVCSLKACRVTQALELGRRMHVEITKRGLEKESHIGNMLVDIYCKCALLAEGERVFDGLFCRDAVAFAAMIAGCIDYGLEEESKRFFKYMHMDGIFPDSVVFINILKSCSTTGALELGQEIHSELTKTGSEMELYAGSTLVDMYGKCGALSEACHVFDGLPVRSVASWTAMIQAFGKNHEGGMAVKCFMDMTKQGVMPNDITFVSLLAACSHSSLVTEGRGFFRLMMELPGIEPTLDHFACIVDLFARSGHVHEAQKALAVMRVPPSHVGSNTLLTACMSYGKLN